ncbi:MAG: DoxX family protein [Colwellia polaris]|jgi:putative oxidoreductase|uniref:DoxX family protein n=1 Tax=Colwellia polaris TaxID=326537 RepID=UPI000A170C4C|nr:DoxX family protein [Colwellia polaris]|tara:strand:+ start:4547 stop:4993 length:447 start_codon:yes stop_codon:yes gene_type:complete
MNSSIIKKVLQTNLSTSTLPLRLIAGVIFSAHGAQKLFAWFGGYGLEGTGQWMDSIGLGPGYLMALLVGSTEFFGGILLILGLLTRPTSAVLAITMVVAIVKVHLANGLFMSNNGYEFALALLAMTLALAISGAGKYSADQLISNRLK